MRIVQIRVQYPTMRSYLGRNFSGLLTMVVSACMVAAQKIFSELTRKHPQDPVYWTALGQVLSKMSGKSAEAARACRRAFLLAPAGAQVQFVTATVLMESGDYVAARPLFETLERRDRKIVAVHVALARVYAGSGAARFGPQKPKMVERLQRQGVTSIAGGGETSQSQVLNEH